MQTLLFILALVSGIVLTSVVAKVENDLTTGTPKYLQREEDEEETASPSGISATHSSISRAPMEPSTSNPVEVCPKVDVNRASNTLVKCQCQGNEILQDGQCKPYPKVTVIAQKNFFFTTEQRPVSDFEVIIEDVSCDLEKSVHMQFTQGQFYLRTRGDMVLSKEAGNLEGQRISNYCVTHHLDDEGDLTWNMNACVPIPSVPRCCPPGQAMVGSSCKPAKSPDFLTPPINAKPFSDWNAKWPNITNFLSPLTCVSDPVQTYPLSYKRSNLISLANGVALGWVPSETLGRRVYLKCSEYCVDGIENPDGSVRYFTSFCFEDPKQQHEKICAGGPCIRKCCKYGESIDSSRFGCVPDSNSTWPININTVKNIANYKIAFGLPLCSPVTVTTDKFHIDDSGNMISKDSTIPPTDYCVETFINGDSQEQGALICPALTSDWQNVRQILFPICNAISLVFLCIVIICYLSAPKPLGNEEAHKLCYALALSVAYISSIVINVDTDPLYKKCIIRAIAMQFGFLATFSWLNVMCFDIWRETRILKMNLQTKPYSKWCSMLYGWGIPFVICLVTVLMQFLVPDNIAGLIKPNIGLSRCWFHDKLEKLVYFYGPIIFSFMCDILLLGLAYCKRNNKPEEENATDVKTKEECQTRYHQNKKNLILFALMTICWTTEILSWKIRPIELWALTDILNCLHGLWFFLILLSDSDNRKQIEEKCPLPFKFARKSLAIPEKIFRYDKISPKLYK